MEKNKLLIVDDEADILELLKSQFKGRYEVITASNGVEGLEMVASERPDVILVDIHMPVMDGFEMVTKFREAGGSGLVLFFTSKRDVKSITRAMKLKCFDFIQKPINTKNLEEKVDGAFSFLSGTENKLSNVLAITQNHRAELSEKTFRSFFHEVANAVSVAEGFSEKISRLLSKPELSLEDKAKLADYNAKVLKALNRIIHEQEAI